MTDKENKIADILLDFYDEYHSNEINRPMIPSIYASKILDSLQEEHVSKDLEEAADKMMPSKYCWSGDGETTLYTREQMKDYFKAGAQWKEKQMMSKAGGAIPCSIFR